MITAVPGVAYRFTRPELLQEALTHRSHGRGNYERLEFLGDSILSLVISARLFERYPEAPEGDLTRMRARLVRGRTLAEVAQRIELGKHLKLGQGEMRSGGFRRSSIVADALEALIAAIYLDGGFEPCRAVINELFDPLIRELPPADELKDPKTRLQEWTQARGRPLPTYELAREEGSDHAKRFHVLCRLRDEELAVEAEGDSRRAAEQAAAAAVLLRLAGRANPS